MVLGLTEDFTTNVQFDAELLSAPTSGLYVNSGTDPSITAENLLAFLPLTDVTFAEWDAAVGYGVYSVTRKKADVVLKGGKIFQSLQTPNLDKDPETEVDFWLETNVESLKIKSFMDRVLDRVYSELHLTKRLVNNQSIYEIGNKLVTLPNNYSGWVFAPKGSDYVSFKLNQISLQKAGTTPVNVYVVNQGQLVTTLQATPSNGQVEFTDVGYTFKGVGEWYFLIEGGSQVFSSGEWIDPQRYDGFICYPVTGVGISPETSSFSEMGQGNGLGFNITAFLDSTSYIQNNIAELGNFVRATFELMTFQMFYANANNRSNRAQLIQMDDNRLMLEVKELNADTAAKRFRESKKVAQSMIEKTFDTQLYQSDDFVVNEGSV